jgi:hypothetical protein
MPFGIEIPPDLFFFTGLIAIGVVLLRSGGGT